MATTFLDSGTDATQDLSTFLATSTTLTDVTSATDQPFHGPRALKFVDAGADIDLEAPFSNVLGDAGRRAQFWVRFSVHPSAINNIWEGRTSAALAVFRIALNTNGTIRMVPVGATAANGSTVMAVNTWHRITLSYTITNTTTFRFVLRVNGVVEVDTTAGTLTRVAADRFRLRSQTAAHANGDAYWFKHFYIDNVADYSDPGWILVTHKRPFGNGASNAWTTQIGSGGSGYGFFHALQVNEQPASQTNGWSIQSASLLSELYEVEGVAVGDVDITGKTVVDYGGWILAKCGVASTGNMVVASIVRVTDFPTSATVLRAYSGTTSIASSDEAIGVNNNSVNQLFSLYECGVFVAYLDRPGLTRNTRSHSLGTKLGTNRRLT